MKTDVSENRTSEQYAQDIFEQLYEAASVRSVCANLLAKSIRLAHQVGPSCWSLTLYPDGIRLNAGPLEVLVLRSHEVFLIIENSEDNYFDERKLGKFLTASEMYYPSVPVNQRLCYVPPEKLAEIYPLIADSHHSFIQLAGARRKKATWGDSFSPGVIRYLNKFLNTSLPMPAYFSDNVDTLFPDQVATDEIYLEGAVSKVLVNAYERNSEARRACIEYYGTNCTVCDLNFEKVYGTVGANFIHVHHLRPLSEVNEEYEVDPIADLRPVCPNCHAMIHRRTPPFSVEEVRRMIKKGS